MKATHLARSRQALKRPAAGQTEKGVLLFLDDFAKLRNATNNFVMFASLSVRLTTNTPVCPSARNKTTPTEPIFIKSDIRVCFSKICL